MTQAKKRIPLWKRLVMMTTGAATLVLGFWMVRHLSPDPIVAVGIPLAVVAGVESLVAVLIRMPREWWWPFTPQPPVPEGDQPRPPVPPETR